MTNDSITLNWYLPVFNNYSSLAISYQIADTSENFTLQIDKNLSEAVIRNLKAGSTVLIEISTLSSNGVILAKTKPFKTYSGIFIVIFPRFKSL